MVQSMYLPEDFEGTNQKTYVDARLNESSNEDGQTVKLKAGVQFL